MNRQYACAILAAALALACAPPAAAEFRSYDGAGNNLTNQETNLWGAAGARFLRAADADYRGDAALGAPIDDRGRPAGRTISNALFAQASSTPSARGMKSGVWQWGQFLDHDITLTPANPAETSMLASPGDPFGVSMIPFSRSEFEFDTALERQQVNHITAYIDASSVYGSDETRALALREMNGGRLRTSGGGLLPPTSDMPGLGALANANNGPESTLFVAGDERANEQFGLISMHALFVREHNRLADALADRHVGDAGWDDERIYQTARRLVGAEVQAITYNEFLPALMGPHAPRAADYQYDPATNAGVANEFATAFFRVGHSMLPDELMLAGDGGVVQETVSLAESFFRPSELMNDPGKVDKVLMGLATQPAQEIDTQLVDGVRNFLFAPQGQMGMDLAALNVQRGRDHGLPHYNALREAYDLAPVSSFAEITSDPSVRAALEELYGTVDNVDPWVGALAEDHLAGASLGPLMTAALVDQFARLRDGDRFFYAGDPLLDSPDVHGLVDLSSVTVMDLLDWNTAMQGMPRSFFMIPEPSTAALMLGLTTVAALGRRRGAPRSVP